MQVELLLHDKPVRLWRFISENETKCSDFEQNRSTKSQKAAGVGLVPGADLNSFEVSELPKKKRVLANFVANKSS